VLVTRSGDVKVVDFGIARAESETSMTRTNLVLGTAAYMSPEQATGGEAGPRSDLYSLGVVMYEMLTGELPFGGEDPIAVTMKHVNVPLRPPKEVVPDIPERLNGLIVRLLAKDPNGRPANASTLVEEIRRSTQEEARSEATASPAKTVTDPPGAIRRTAPYRGNRRGGRGHGGPNLSSIVPWLLVVLFVVGVVVGGMLVLRVLGGIALP